LKRQLDPSGSITSQVGCAIADFASAMVGGVGSRAADHVADRAWCSGRSALSPSERMLSVIFNHYGVGHGRSPGLKRHTTGGRGCPPIALSPDFLGGGRFGGRCGLPRTCLSFVGVDCCGSPARIRPAARKRSEHRPPPTEFFLRIFLQVRGEIFIEQSIARIACDAGGWRRKGPSSVLARTTLKSQQPRAAPAHAVSPQTS